MIPPDGPLEPENELAREPEPLPADWDQHAALVAQSFAAPRELTGAERELLAGFAHLCLRFAHMEERVQGSVVCDLPAHLTVIRGEHADSLVAEAEALAAAERANLEIPDGPVEDLADLLDARGIKVIESTVAPARDGGAFLFDPRTGPALLTLAPTATPRGRAIVAHEYCHLLADIDPYENRFCPEAGRLGARAVRPTPGVSAADLAFDEIEIAELRADLFARALLVPENHFRRALRDFGPGPSRLADVAYYYGVEASLIESRLADLGLPPHPAGPPPEADAPAAPDGGPRLFPSPAARFVNLSLALFLKGKVTLEQMARLLGTDAASAMRFLAWSDVAPPVEKRR